MFENIFVGIVATAEAAEESGNFFWIFNLPEGFEIYLGIAVGVIALGLIVFFIARGYFKEVKKIEAARAAQQEAAKQKAAKQKAAQQSEAKKTGDKKKKKK